MSSAIKLLVFVALAHSMQSAEAIRVGGDSNGIIKLDLLSKGNKKKCDACIETLTAATTALTNEINQYLIGKCDHRAKISDKINQLQTHLANSNRLLRECKTKIKAPLQIELNNFQTSASQLERQIHDLIAATPACASNYNRVLSKFGDLKAAPLKCSSV